MNTKATIGKDGSIELTAIQRNVLKKDAGKLADIVVDRRANIEKIAFFEGPITQYFFYQHEKGVFRDFKETREALKYEFNPVYIKDVHGMTRVTSGSLSIIYASNKATAKLLETAQRFFMENGFEFPDSQDYAKWRDSSPLVGEVYPPLRRLADKWKKKIF